MELQKKKLASGNFQVRFSLEGFYGYMLVDPSMPMDLVAEKILQHLDRMRYPERYFQDNLYSMSSLKPQTGKILIYRHPAQALAA